MLQLKLKGSSTIEASFIMPLVIGVLFIVIILSYHIHNNVINQSVLNETNVIAAANKRCSEYIDNEECVKIYETMSAMRPTGSNINSYGVNVSSTKIVSGVKHSTSLNNVPVIGNIIKKKNFQTEQTSTLDFTYPEEILREVYVSKLKKE